MMESRGGKPKHLQLQGYSVAAWRPVCDGSSGIGKHSPMCPGGGGGGRWGGIPGDLETCAEQRTLLLDPSQNYPKMHLMGEGPGAILSFKTFPFFN